MVERIDIANVTIWGMPVGAVAWQGTATEGHGTFQYHRSFLAKGLDLSPIHMGLKEALVGDGIFAFRKRSPDPELDTFKGLPGLLADCLPDKFGNAVIDAWLARQGRDSSSFNPVERLYDVGVAGIHRLLLQEGRMREARVIVVAAGMEGALASVVGGLTDKPVIAVPTSVGYGASFGGVAALLGMLNSCAPTVAVVNIDNGFGAGVMASVINRL